MVLENATTSKPQRIHPRDKKKTAWPGGNDESQQRSVHKRNNILHICISHRYTQTIVVDGEVLVTVQKKNSEVLSYL